LLNAARIPGRQNDKIKKQRTRVLRDFIKGQNHFNRSKAVEIVRRCKNRYGGGMKFFYLNTFNYEKSYLGISSVTFYNVSVVR